MRQQDFLGETGTLFAALIVTLLAWMRQCVQFNVWYMKLNNAEVRLWGFNCLEKGRGITKFTSLSRKAEETAYRRNAYAFTRLNTVRANDFLSELNISHCSWKAHMLELGICPWCWNFVSSAAFKLITNKILIYCLRLIWPQNGNHLAIASYVKRDTICRTFVPFLSFFLSAS